MSVRGSRRVRPQDEGASKASEGMKIGRRGKSRRLHRTVEQRLKLEQGRGCLPARTDAAVLCTI